MAKTKTATIAELIPDDQNANAGTERGSGVLEHSLRTFGAGRSVLVDKENRIIAGNKTVETAAACGMMQAVIVETRGDQIVGVKRTDIDLDSPEGRGLAIADNRAGELNLAWNQEVLAEINGEIDLTPYFFEDELDFSGTEEPVEGLTDEDDVPELGESPVSERGDIWTLGNHRVMCGDSTDAGDAALLMDGDKADMCFTDPPYGIGYNSNYASRDGSKNVHDPIEADKNTDIAEPACQAIKANIKSAAPVFVCTRWDVLREWQEAIEANGLTVKNCIVWLKSNHGMGDLLGSFGSRWEAVLFAHDGGVKLETRHDDIWDVGQIFQGGRQHHPTEKTPRVAQRAIEVTGTRGIILDLFLGSGSTLIAAEKTNRRCYGMEISPAYVDVIVKRWQDFTGKEARHEDGRTFDSINAAKY